MNDPLRISVVIATYNGIQRIERTIRSVLAQTGPAHEIIVVDDGSTDTTPSIASLFEGRIRYVRTDNGGQQRARNHGVGLATGDWIALLDHDDLWEPGYLAEIAALARTGNIDVTLCNSVTWDENGGGQWRDRNRFIEHAPAGYWQQVGAEPTDRWTILDRYDHASYLRWHPAQPSTFSIRRALYDALGGFDVRLHGNGAENFEFETRALRVARVGLIWPPLVKTVRHDSNASRDGLRLAMDGIACLQFMLDHHDLTPDQHDEVASRLQERLPQAIGAAFLLQDFAAVRRYRALLKRSPGFKTWLKTSIAHLPEPVATGLARALKA